MDPQRLLHHSRQCHYELSETCSRKRRASLFAVSRYEIYAEPVPSTAMLYVVSFWTTKSFTVIGVSSDCGNVNRRLCARFGRDLFRRARDPDAAMAVDRKFKR